MQTSLIIENLLTNELSTHIRTLIPTHPHTHTHTQTQAKYTRIKL